MAARYRILAIIAWALLTSTCGPASATPRARTPTPTVILALPTAIRITAAPPASPTPIVTSAPTSPPSVAALPTPTLVMPPALRAAVDWARVDLADRLDAPLDSIQLEEVTSDEFPAGNLGCPQGETAQTPGAAMPAIVSGWRITLRAAEETYEYRARASEVVYCGPL